MMREVSWITPQKAGFMVAANYGRRDILDGKPQKQLLDWVTQGRVASMAIELSFHAPDLPPAGIREENVWLASEEWQSILAGEHDLSNFYRSSEVSSIGLESSTVAFRGIRLAKDDVIREMMLAGWPVDNLGDQTTSTARHTPTEPCTSPSESMRGCLPPNATAADRRDEEYAHVAARLVRSGKKLSEAIREVAPTDHTREAASVEHAIRRTFRLMYNLNGNPL